MVQALTLGKYSIGVGDRFGHQARAQLEACALAVQAGVEIVPVWNKSHREHMIIGSDPASTRAAADAAVRALDWRKPYHVDADHIGLNMVDRFIPHADFYTIDVADQIGQRAPTDKLEAFVRRHPELTGRLQIQGIERPLQLSGAALEAIAEKYLAAVQEAGRVYRHIALAKDQSRFITEVSLDETDQAQSPAELVVILAALADEAIPLQTIAPKFSGRFNKGVDYAGNLTQFEAEFRNDLAVVAHAVKHYQLPPALKLSVHSGSDKFSLYPLMRWLLQQQDAGLHLKTAGTTWLEEVIGLAEAGGAGLALAKEIYAGALDHLEELCVPYAMVIDIDRSKLPAPATVSVWSSEQFTSALRHDSNNQNYNPHLRQLLHVGYKIAAQMGRRYLEALRTYEELIARNVSQNLYQRHLKPLFVGLPIPRAAPGPVSAADGSKWRLR